MTRSRTSGFTLVELLIALSLVSLILLMLFSALTLASRSWEAINTSTERSADLRIARQFIERSLRQWQPVDINIEGSLQRLPEIAGNHERLDWVANLTTHLGLPGLYFLRLTVEAQDEGLALVLYRWLAQPAILSGGNDWPAWDAFDNLTTSAVTNARSAETVNSGAFGRTVLMPEVDRFDIRYFGRRAGESEETWGEEWLEQPYAPAALSIELATPALSWAPLIINLSRP